MSNKTRLQNNNIALQSLIDKANSLPDAGSGGGSGSVETCTITTSGLQGQIDVVGTIIDKNGNISSLIGSCYDDDMINYKFIKGSAVVFIDEHWGNIPNGVECEGASLFGYYMQQGVAVFELTSNTASFVFT